MTLEIVTETQCTACGVARCGHEEILSKFLGCGDAQLCLECLSFALGVDPERFAPAAAAHLKKKACLWAAWERVGCSCRLGEATAKLHVPHRQTCAV